VPPVKAPFTTTQLVNNNTANGLNALNHNTTGSSNVGDGINALFNNTIGTNNIALGDSDRRKSHHGQ